MKQLFNNENRIAVILKNIEMQSVCSVESLAAKLDVSQKTIRNDIKELNCHDWTMKALNEYCCNEQYHFPFLHASTSNLFVIV